MLKHGYQNNFSDISAGFRKPFYQIKNILSSTRIRSLVSNRINIKYWAMINIGALISTPHFRSTIVDGILQLTRYMLHKTMDVITYPYPKLKVREMGPLGQHWVDISDAVYLWSNRWQNVTQLHSNFPSGILLSNTPEYIQCRLIAHIILYCRKLYLKILVSTYLQMNHLENCISKVSITLTHTDIYIYIYVYIYIYI